MRVSTLRYCAALAVLTVAGAAAMYGQSGAEYGVVTANSAGAAASIKLPAFNLGLPGNASSTGPGASSNTASVPAEIPEVAAKTNRQFFQDHSGSNAARISVHTVPILAQAWIDGKFVGPTPLDLRLAPGHYRVLVRATNMQETVREIDVAAKQAQIIDVTLKSANQSTIVLHWPSQK